MKEFEPGFKYILSKDLVPYTPFRGKWVDEIDGMEVKFSNLPSLGLIEYNNETYYIPARWCKKIPKNNVVEFKRREK